MKRMKAQLHKTKGSIGVETLKVKCEQDGEVISADYCRLRHCKANKGFKEYYDKGGNECVEVLCGLEEMANGG